MAFWWRQLVVFTWLEAKSCVFPFAIFLGLAFGKLVQVPGLGRYDLMLVLCLLVQIWMLRAGLETWDELKVICVFHLLGLALELYKVRLGSWSYPEFAWSKIAGVPLYSGFMYASIASYMTQAWRLFGLRLQGWPDTRLPSVLAALVYINFYTHHFLPDMRVLLTGMIVVCFLKTTVHFSVNGFEYRMPLLLSFVLIGFFVWVAENLGSFSGAWLYPHQQNGWQWVDLGKWGAWSLLVILSLVVVAALKDLKAKRSNELLRKPVVSALP